MSTLLKEQCYHDNYIVDEIESHPAWHGNICGLEAERLLKGKKTPYLYILRAGECEMNYYVTFVHADLSVRHQPFVIIMGDGVWSFINAGPGGPFKEETFGDVLNQILHCKKEDLLARVTHV